MEFDAEERAAIIAEGRRQAQAPAVHNLSPIGCVLMIFGTGLATAGFWLARNAGLHSPLMKGILLGAVLAAILAGAVIELFFGSGYALRKAGRPARAAIDWLSGEYQAGSQEQRRSAAVAAILHAWYSSGGPWTAETYDFDEARGKLGPALPYVEAVERVLRQELTIYPVFTLEKERRA